MEQSEGPEMSRLANIPTWELWNIPKKEYVSYYKLLTTDNYHELGIKLMTKANKDFADTHKLADILDHKLYMARIKTSTFYLLRLEEIKENK